MTYVHAATTRNRSAPVVLYMHVATHAVSHFPSLPSMTLQLALKVTGVELELIRDPNIYFMTESSIRGRLSYVAQCYAIANFLQMPNYWPCCISAAIRCTQHVRHIRCQLVIFDFSRPILMCWVLQTTLRPGNITKCNPQYTNHLHSLHNAYPLAPEHISIDKDLLSDMMHYMLDKTSARHHPSRKLMSNLHDKTRYISHYHCLKFYLAHGLQLVKIHRVVAFTQRNFMLPLIKYRNDRQKNAKSDFESLLCKLIANAFYGKMVENVRKWVNVQLTVDPTKCVHAASKVSYKQLMIVNKDWHSWRIIWWKYCYRNHRRVHGW